MLTHMWREQNTDPGHTVSASRPSWPPAPFGISSLKATPGPPSPQHHLPQPQLLSFPSCGLRSHGVGSCGLLPHSLSSRCHRHRGLKHRSIIRTLIPSKVFWSQKPPWPPHVLSLHPCSAFTPPASLHSLISTSASPSLFLFQLGLSLSCPPTIFWHLLLLCLLSPPPFVLPEGLHSHSCSSSHSSSTPLSLLSRPCSPSAPAPCPPLPKRFPARTGAPGDRKPLSTDVMPHHTTPSRHRVGTGNCHPGAPPATLLVQRDSEPYLEIG